MHKKWSINMDLGNFSLSLAVKDLSISKAFYEKLGFEAMGGDEQQGWLIMKSPSCVMGLFQGMFEKNTLTFNPGWDNEANQLPTFTDIRDIQKELKKDGVTFVSEADENSSGPANCIVMDPDGNPILIDQHV
jgi:catechol 2,3-dioxygenase-like lactoylglutathione lyase family enzyme